LLTPSGVQNFSTHGTSTASTAIGILQANTMVKPSLRKSKLSGRPLTVPAAKSASAASKRSVNEVLLGHNEKASKANRTQVDDQPTLSTKMEPDKLASKIQDIQMRDADDPPASKRSNNEVSDKLTNTPTKASSTKLVNERGKTGSPPDKRSRANSASLISPPNDEDNEDATTTISAPKETPTGPTYAKAVVGFSTHDEVRAESTGPNGAAKSVTTKSLA
jgi:hypothetical protein